MTKNLFNKISMIFIVLAMIINIASYILLPGHVAIHINASGTADSYVPKIIYLIATPLILIAISMYLYVCEYNFKFKALVLELIFFLLNIWIIFSQIKI